MNHTYASAPERIRIEKYDLDKAECHSCGKVGKPRWLVHFAHLCQHFVALCPKCWKKFKEMLHGVPGKATRRARQWRRLLLRPDVVGNGDARRLLRGTRLRKTGPRPAPVR